MKVLGGDIGGTKTALAIYEDGRLIRRDTLKSADFPSLESLVQKFLSEGDSVAAACFGIAGPINADQTCRATNLPWFIDARVVSHALEIPKVLLVNDFHALSIGITCLPESDFEPLCDAPADQKGPWAVIGAGTGLGEAVLVKDSTGDFRVISSEGSHADFGPRNDLEIDLLRFLTQRHGGHVSYERIASGSGLPALYDFFLARGLTPTPEVAREVEEDSSRTAAIVSTHGMKGDDELCVQALSLFTSVYGAAAGNLALTVIPRGGLYVAGGISPKILPKLKDGTFMKAFRDKGRLSHVLQKIPVKVVLNPDAGLIGAGAIARKL